ncbi:DUF2971 domain-containing protein [Mucilaginibacter gilvus]|nr:DUF2971 domain-containing protein [Mucilaginibacter gilvus]
MFRPLYKYRANDKYLIDLITKSELYFSSPIDFNDPFDSNLEILNAVGKEEIIEHYRKTVKPSDDFFSNILEKSLNDKSVFEIINSTLKKEFYKWVNEAAICSLSKTSHDLLMWGHYTNCHKGVCLGFDPSLLETSLGTIYDVKYTKPVPKINIYDNPTDAVIEFFCAKSNHWKYEKEVRIIQGKVGPYKFPKEALVKIVFGVKCDDKEKVKIMELVYNSGYQNVDFFQSFTDKKYFRLLGQKIRLIDNKIDNYKK